MRRTRSLIAQLVVACLPLLLVLACKGSPPAATSDTPPATATPAAAAAVDWCPEHGVPESQCTRCNPKLIADFQAKGDWCSEHGVPESQCTLCHPDLIEKFRKMAPGSSATPATTEAAQVADWCGAHGVPESICTRCNANLIPDFQAKGDWCKEHGLPESQCTICHPDLVEKFAKMNPHAQRSGNAEAPKPDAYAKLRVRLAAPETAAKAGIQAARVEEQVSDGAFAAPLRLAFDETRAARISAPTMGVVREVLVTPGTRVTPGAVVAVVASVEVPEVSARLRAAEAALLLADQTVEREQRLVADKISARKDLEEAQRQQAAARAAVEAARGSLASLGASAEKPDGSGRLTLRTPRAGVVTRVDAAVGQAVSPDHVLVEVNDPTRLWADLDLAERDAPHVHERDEISITFGALPDETTKGTITWISPEVDPKTRTIHARAEVLNRDGSLRAGMFGRARVAGASRRSLLVPTDAVQDGPDGPVAFVRLNAQEFQPRAIRIGRASATQVEILAGLLPGDEVVTQGSFLLKTEIMKGSLGAGCCDEVEK